MAGPRTEIELVLAPQFVANPAPLIEHFRKWLAALPTPLQPGAVPLESLPAGARSCLLAARVCEPELDFDVEDGIDGDGLEGPGAGAATGPTPLAELVRGRGCDARSAARFHLRDVSPVFLAYHLCAEGATSVDVAADAGEGGAGGGGGGDAPAYTHLVLPAAETEGLWESLVLHPSVKRSLLSYSASSLLFGDAAVDPQLVAWNHVVLLHGPPGTGKTSLCKALAHKLSSRLLGRYPSAALIEINAHSLFSRWFSESGKLVTRLFGHISELVEGGDVFVFLLVDEVESLTAARSAAVRGSEPSDAVRVVNAVLTAIDALRARPNVLLLATSNVSEAIDVAFIDRADVRLHIGPPDAAARFAILGSSFAELCRAGVAAPPLFTPEGRGAAALPAPAGVAAVYESLCERIAAQQQRQAAEARGAAAGQAEGAGGAAGCGSLSARGPACGSAGMQLEPSEAHCLEAGGRAAPAPVVACASPLLLSSALGRAFISEAIRCLDGAAGGGAGTSAGEARVAVGGGGGGGGEGRQVASAVLPGVSFCPGVTGPLAVELLLLRSSETTAAASTPVPVLLSAHDMAAVLLLGAALASEGFSGRALRKLPLQAHARFVRRMGPAPALRVALAFLQYAAWEAGNRRGEDKALAQ